MTNSLTARSIKCVIVLSPIELLNVAAPNGQARVAIRIAVAGRTVLAELNAKSVRKAQATIRENSVDGVVIALQGRLAAGDKLEDAGLAVTVKAPKAEVPAEG